MAVVPPGKGEARGHSLPRARALRAITSFVECRLETGRTHQIRVHLASLGHPLLGDVTYGARAGRHGADRELDRLVSALDGVALHAEHLALRASVDRTALRVFVSSALQN